MKRFIITASILLVIIGLFVILIAKYGNVKDEEEEPITAYRFDSDMDTEPQTIQSGKVKLVFDPNTTNFVYTDKYGHEWLSSPEGAEEGGSDAVKSLLLVEYKNSAGRKSFLSSREHSVNKGNYTYEKENESTIRIDFTIGLISKTYFIPTVLSEERYNELREAGSSETKSELRSKYRAYDPAKLAESDPEKLKTLAEKYPDLNEGKKVYELYDNLQNYQKEEIENLLIADGYTHEDWERDIEYGQTDQKQEILPTVNVTMYLKLENDELVVEIPYDKIEYYQSAQFTELRVLPFFCASNMQTEGFLFVPDGSGAIINFNNGKTAQNYAAKVYGWDYGLSRDIIINDPRANFPVYGASFTDANASVLCIIEDGDSYASIEADVAGRQYLFNYATNIFTMVHSEKADIGSRANSDFQVYEKDLPRNEKIQLRYIGINSANYVDMAKTYRQYLIDTNPDFAKQVESDELPVAVELLGAVAKMQHVLGFPKEKPYALTTYSEMDAILKDLNKNGWTDVNVVLNGWFNKGIDHKWPEEISLIGKLGSKKNFKQLLDSAKGLGYNVSLKADFMFARKDTLFDSYRTRRDSARFISREVAAFKPISNIWYGELDEEEQYYLAKPNVTLETIDSFLKDASKLGTKSIAFNSIGNTLGADYYRKKVQTRQSVMKGQTEKLRSLQANKNVIYGGNAYAVPYADIILDFPIRASKASVEDRSIPFFPIALHGYVRYTGDSINITNDYITNVLNSAETGAGLYFIFMDADTNELQESAHTEYFGASYSAWKQQANELYTRFKKDFGHLTKATIENHRMINDNVFVTEYSDGTVVYVNYRTVPYEIGGFSIPARDWVVVKGGN